MLRIEQGHGRRAAFESRIVANPREIDTSADFIAEDPGLPPGAVDLQPDPPVDLPAVNALARQRTLQRQDGDDAAGHFQHARLPVAVARSG